MSWDGPVSGERLLFLAPHPDDETLAAGALLQRTIARGGRARVVFATDGDNNPWTQRLVEGRIRIRPDDSARFGRRRRAEALAALAELGLAADDALFLGLPDQAITDLVIAGDGGAVERLAAALRDWRTTLVLMRLALERASPDPLPRALSYIVHRTGSMDVPAAGDLPETTCLKPTDEEMAGKRRAILRHATQLTVHRRKFLSFAGRPEVFFKERGPDMGRGLHPVRRARLDDGALRLDLELHPRLGAFGRPTLHLASGLPGTRRSLSLTLRWRRGQTDVRDALTAQTAGRAALRGGRRGGTVEVPLASLPDSDRLFVKLERRFGFFDEGGWLEVNGCRRGDA
ncbi:MAG: hypothetical protein AUG09_05005 [Acidobacteria bacterium 13_1_20CM_2_68_7]|nr:MAG: hypothetical protein AUG09_05005 [Acidobacteria bacterium 13_1_20CM_2_68_7]